MVSLRRRCWFVRCLGCAAWQEDEALIKGSSDMPRFEVFGLMQRGFGSGRTNVGCGRECDTVT